MNGELLLVGTPIGNLGDISERALSVMAAVDVVCCEDTRRTRELLTHAGIRAKKLLSLTEHNEDQRADELIDRMRQGERIALVSDAGTPAISDPGARLVRRAVEAGVSVTSVPGPSAVTTALVLSGFDTRRYCFEGFLPRRGSERAKRLEDLSHEKRTTVIFEAPGRVAPTLADLAEVCGPDRTVAVCRELTKLHEEIWRGTLEDAAALFSSHEVRGEVTLVLHGAPAPPGPSDATLAVELEKAMNSGLGLKEASKSLAKNLGVPSRKLYDLGLALGDGRRRAKP